MSTNTDIDTFNKEIVLARAVIERDQKEKEYLNMGLELERQHDIEVSTRLLLNKMDSIVSDAQWLQVIAPSTFQVVDVNLYRARHMLQSQNEDSIRKQDELMDMRTQVHAELEQARKRVAELLAVYIMKD
jgi:flagellar motor switch/type III secretory pathway protein FliN